MTEKSICSNCKHCFIRSIYRGCQYPTLTYYCKIPSRMIPEEIDYVSGEVTKAKFSSCRVYNDRGECSEFSKGKPERKM